MFNSGSFAEHRPPALEIDDVIPFNGGRTVGPSMANTEGVETAEIKEGLGADGALARGGIKFFMYERATFPLAKNSTCLPKISSSFVLSANGSQTL